MATDLKLLVKGINDCTIVGLFTVDYINSILIAGNEFIVKADHPSLDLGQVTTCDSSSVAMLIKWWGMAQALNKKINFINLPQEMWSIMKISNVDDLLKLSI